MPIKKLFAMVCTLLLAGQLLASDVVLNPKHPDHYVVVKGDTLWDISAMFLRDPWLWPEVWHVNPQIVNPHLIYPGDLLSLIYVDGKPQLRMSRGAPGGDNRLSPRVRYESLDDAIPTIPLDAIRQFLTRTIVVDENELDTAPYVLQSADEHVISGAGDRVYARGIKDRGNAMFDIYEQGDAYIDPDSGELLGYAALFIGSGPVQKFGDPATLLLTETTREVRAGHRLRPADSSDPVLHFRPHPTVPDTEGHIIAVIDGVTQIGQFNVVALDLGTREGIEVGHVMRVFQKGDTVRDRISGKRLDKVTLPDEDAGLVMVFRTFEKVSFALVMEATRAIHINDYVRTP